MMHSPHATLVLLCKRPAPGQGKQRLAHDVGTAAAHAIAEKLLASAIEDLDRWAGPTVISPANQGDVEWASKLSATATVIAQTEGNLGQRINAIDEKLRSDGHQKIIYIGSDCPLLSKEDFQQASTALLEHDTIFMPAEDGGVVLMASRLHWPDLGELPWSTNTLGNALEQCCLQAGHSISTYGLRTDLDTRRDAQSLYWQLAMDKRQTRVSLRECIKVYIKPSLSIIIPCYKDESRLEILLSDLEKNIVMPDEIIVIDADNSFECHQLCQGTSAAKTVRWIPSSPCRGRQLREGAEHATGDILWFLHADARIDPQATYDILESVSQGTVAGYFAFNFDNSAFDNRKPWMAALVESLTRWRNTWGAIYGDQGIFITRQAYYQHGGHSPAPLFEEIQLIRQLRLHANLVAIPQGLTVNPQRWQRDGWLYRSLRNRLFALLHALGVSPVTLAARYHPLKRRRENHA